MALGPFRTLWSVLLPQSIPVIVAVAIFHLVYTWNDYFGPVLYLSGTPDLQTVALGLSRFNGIHFRDPGLIQAGTLMTLIIPVIAFLLTQRFFTRGLVVTGIDKSAAAVDGGNSKTDLALVDDDGRLLAALRGPTTSHQQIGFEPGIERMAGLVGDLRNRAGLVADAPQAELVLMGWRGRTRRRTHVG